MEAVSKWLGSQKMLNVKTISIIGLIVLVVFIVYMFFSKKDVPQGFEGDNVVLDTSTQSMFPYTTSPINNLDQYELEAVFENEGDRKLNKREVNRLTRQYPLDWVNYPPNSSKFQSGQAKYIEGFSSNSSAEELNEPYRDIGDGNLTPPDTVAIEKQEREILATYAPRKAGEMKSYDTYDAQKLLEQIYKPKGLEPIVNRRDKNVFEVVSTRSLKNTVEYEDDLPDASVSSGTGLGAGEATIEVPPTATEQAASRDPFYEPTNSTRSSRTDYMRWTPGLERMFAPTNSTTDWIGQPTDN
jgi:hypothetical protein